MSARINIIGRRFGRGIVFAEAPPKFSCGKPRRRSWLRCDCGKEFIASNRELLKGHTKSCGCLKHERWNLVHGHTGGYVSSKTYTAWVNMKSRCNNPKNKGFKNYGGKGIFVCWGLISFEHFLYVLGECPPRLEIDRWPNKYGSYKCGCCAQCLDRGWQLNVRWATNIQQGRNKTNNTIVSLRGFTACLSELCEHFGADYKRTWGRLQRGWNLENAVFFQPITNEMRKTIDLKSLKTRKQDQMILL